MKPPAKPAIYHSFAFHLSRVTPVRRLPSREGRCEITLRCTRPSVALQQRAARILRRSPDPHPLIAIKPLHPATHARRLTPEQALHYERVCTPVPKK